MKTSETLLLEGEKLAALGKMAAALTHEINNPASAARRAAAELGDLLADLRIAALGLARFSLHSEQTALLSKLQQEAVKRASGSSPSGAAPRASTLCQLACSPGGDPQHSHHIAYYSPSFMAVCRLALAISRDSLPDDR